MLNRRNVKSEPKDDFNACEDYFTLVVVCHILCAALEILNMNDLNDKPCCELIPSNLQEENKDSKQQILRKVADSIVAKTVNLSLQFKDDLSSAAATSKDHVFEYACKVTSLGLLFLNYREAIKEGDGQRA